MVHNLTKGGPYKDNIVSSRCFRPVEGCVVQNGVFSLEVPIQSSVFSKGVFSLFLLRNKLIIIVPHLARLDEGGAEHFLF